MVENSSDISGMMIELSRMIKRACEHSTNVNLLRIHALTFIEDHENVTLTDFAKGMNISPSTASVFVSRLERMKLVKHTKDPNNRRKVQIQLSVAGKRAVTDANKKKKKVLTKIFASLSAKERDDLSTIFSKLLRAHRA
jgi:DNA-binding MarR family transcriptional regulator